MKLVFLSLKTSKRHYKRNNVFKRTAMKKLMSYIFCGPVIFWSLAALGEETASKPSALEQFFPFILIILIFYFILIRPQQKKLKRQESFLTRLKRGDEVITSSGIFGKIEGLTEQFVILEVADNVRIRVLKSKIASFIKELTEKQEKPSSSK